MLGSIKKAAGNVGRFLSTTGKSALRRVGDTASTIRKVGTAVNQATGGAAGAANPTHHTTTTTASGLRSKGS